MRLGLLAVLALAAGAHAATAPAAHVEPSAPATSFTAVVAYPGGSELVSWQAPEHLAVRLLAGQGSLGGTWAHAGDVVYRYAPGSPLSVLRGSFASRPDAPPLLDPLLGPRDFALAQARAGALRLRPAGAGAWQVKLFAPANGCAGFGSGTIELTLRRADFLPLRLLERHGAIVARNLSLVYRSVNEPLAAATFAAPALGKVAYREDKGFVRASPAAAARHLSYLPRVPRSLPAGFALSASGWAKRSATTGPRARSRPRTTSSRPSTAAAASRST